MDKSLCLPSCLTRFNSLPVVPHYSGVEPLDPNPSLFLGEVPAGQRG